ncbi:MAG TPA: ornithine carbamoyltransferase, partial [Myxococcota bacterium]|nr:ornithine carbamoyltransferase [Myxococcota bacterium]
MARHFIADFDISITDQGLLLDRALDMKARSPDFGDTLRGKTLGMLFHKSSTRTRVSFEAGMHQLGGHAIFLHTRDNQMGRGETVADTARVLSRYVDLLLIRTFAHAEVEELAANSRVPVVNALDDLLHPCQALADLLTLREHRGGLAGAQLVYIGDGNNMAHSLMLAGAMAGVHVRVVAPKAYAPRADMLARAQALGKVTQAQIEVTDSLEGVDGADAVYTDVWTSMGQEGESAKRLLDFRGYQVDTALMARANVDAIFLHCL